MKPNDNCGLCLAYHEDYRVVFKNDKAVSVVITNPYNAGHLMVLPRKHVLNLNDLTADESNAINGILYQSQKRLIELFPESPPIIGMNAGVHSTQVHIHYHVLPSDASFRGFYRATHPTGALEGVKLEQNIEYLSGMGSLEEIAKKLRPR